MQNLTPYIYIAMTLGGCFFIYQAIRQFYKARRAEKTWQTVSGVVLSSEMHSRRSVNTKGRGTTSYTPLVSYQYRVGETTYPGNKIGFGSTTYGRRKAEQILARYPQGSPARVWYDPADPSNAVLETQAVNFWNDLILGTLMIIIGVAAALAARA